MVKTRHVHNQTPRPSKAWCALSVDQKMEKIHPVMASLPNRNFMIVGLSREVALSVMVHKPMEVGLLGEELRRLEDHLRQGVGEPLEVYCEQRRDTNKPRDPLVRQRIVDWMENRKTLKQQGVNAD